MYSRQGLIEVFSTFIEFQADQFDGWLVDARLRKNFEQHQAQLSEEFSEELWLSHWYQLWYQRADRYALGHLSAYLQETCYWSAQRVMRALGHTPYGLSDCFQWANVAVKKVLTGYDPARGSLKGYAGLVYGSLLRDTLRQRQAADICTDWTLLRRVGKRRLLESLYQAGLSASAIAQYRLAWRCYQTLYVPAKETSRKQRQPDRAQWSAIAALYNTERLAQLSYPGPALTPETMEHCLTECVRWIRAYTYPSVVSLNTANPGGGELQDELPAASTSMATLIALEDSQQRQAQQAQLSSVLIQSIGALPTDTQELLHLYYQCGWTQKRIAQQLSIKQCNVSRRLSRTREILLSALLDWAQAALHTSPTPDLVASMGTVLEEWLMVHYRSRQQEPL